MRIEQIHLFFYGVLLFACVWACTLAISSAQLRLHLRAFFLAMGFGVIIVPGHGEWIAAPILAALTLPLRSHLLILGGAFLLAWWLASFVALKFLTQRSSKRPGNDF